MWVVPDMDVKCWFMTKGYDANIDVRQNLMLKATGAVYSPVNSREQWSGILWSFATFWGMDDLGFLQPNP